MSKVNRYPLVLISIHGKELLLDFERGKGKALEMRRRKWDRLLMMVITVFSGLQTPEL